MADRSCGTCHPPADDSPDREIIDRFADFLREAGPRPAQADIIAGRTRPRSASARYRLGFLAWWVGQVDIGPERPEWCENCLTRHRWSEPCDG